MKADYPVRLADYNNAHYDPGAGILLRAIWLFVGQPMMESMLLSSAMRVRLLRLFGATIGNRNVIKPNVQLKFPWNLVMGDDCWIGEHSWIDNLAKVHIGSNVCISQGVYVCTGNHDWGDPAFGLRIEKVELRDCSWLAARSVVLPGVVVGAGAMAASGAVVTKSIPAFEIHAGNPAVRTRERKVRPPAVERPPDAKRFLFINQFFWPDASATSQILTDLAVGLAARGHQVHVVCSAGGYNRAVNSETLPKNIVVHRVAAFPFTRGTFGRMVSYASFYVMAGARALLCPRADVVVSLTTPPVISIVGTAIKLLKRSRHIIWEQDVYPDVAVDLEYFEAGGWIDRHTGRAADYAREHADAILALGSCMRERLLRRGVPPRNIFIVENWADGTAITPRPRPGNCDELVILYSGNLGLAHDVSTITEAMHELSQERFRFLFTGGGKEHEDLQALCSKLSLEKVEFRPYVSRDRLSEGLSLGDIGLVTQHESCCGTVVPSKLYGIMAAGRPVLFIGPRNSTVAETIALYQCGWQIDCGDVDGLVRLLRRLSGSHDEVISAGARARAALLQHYDLKVGVARIVSVLEAIVPDSKKTPQSTDVSIRNERAK